MVEDIYTLDHLSDKQKSLLTQLAYINLNIEQYGQLKDKGKITIRDFAQILSSPDTPYLGTVAEKVTGIDTTSKELIQEIMNNHLGNIEIIGLKQDEKSSFFAIAFQDKKGNRGMSFRGTDVSNSKDLVLDLLTDANEYITNNDEQVEQALQFFEQYTRKEGSNFLFGHSLGGNLVEHIMLDNSSSIENAFVINPEHISQKLLDTQDKVDTFNDSRKFSCYVIGGDWVSDLKESNLFQNNINYIKNNDSLKHNILSDHAIESASINELGEFDIISREEAFKEHKHTIQRLFTYAMAIVGKVAKGMYDSSSAILNKIFSREDEIKALPEASHLPKKTDNIKESVKLENFETKDSNYNIEQAKRNLSSIHTYEYINTRAKEQTHTECDEH